MRNGDDKTVLFLFGREPTEASLLEAQALRGPLQRSGWGVQLAALSPDAARGLRERLGQSVACPAWGPAGLPVVGRLFLRRLTGAPAVIHAWDLEAAGAARKLMGPGPRLCVTLDRSISQGLIPQWMNPLRSADAVVSVVSHRVVPAGLPVARANGYSLWEVPPAVDLALPKGAQARRRQVRATLGVVEAEGPVVVAPPIVRRGSGHLEAAWATFILRRGGVPAHLVLPHAGRETSRILRFAAACREQSGIVSSNGKAGWLDLLAAADIVVVPDGTRNDAVLTGYALGSGRVVVVRSEAEAVGATADSLLSSRTCLLTADARPLSLARVLLRAWQDRQEAAGLVRSAGQEVAEQCEPTAIVETYLQIYTASKHL